MQSELAARPRSASAARARSATEYSAFARTRSASMCPHDASGRSAHGSSSALETVAVHSDFNADDGESGNGDDDGEDGNGDGVLGEWG